MVTGVNVLKGYYVFENGKFISRGDMDLINSKLKQMKMLAGSTETNKGEFYFDPLENTYWQYVQYEDYQTEMWPVSLEFIKVNFPNVDSNDLLNIPR